MTHQQAYHTSCRTGLSGTSGFQINAASPALGREQLAALSKSHARYETPKDLPYEPTAEEMRTFPVALKMSVVPSLGPVVSRTAYVGREYRGQNGAPDEGRFGNYFCHMVVGAAGDDPFDGFNAVELWDAPHWTISEAGDTTLPELDALTPGPLDIDAVLAVVAASPAGVAAAMLDGARDALTGGPPVLVFDPEAGRAVTWLAWLVYALPAQLGRALTFSTFEGRPQDVLDLHVVVTTPACDPGPALSTRFTRIDVTAPFTATVPTLYARAATDLAERGSEALAGAVRRVASTDLVDQGAELALVGGTAQLVGDSDLPAVLRQIHERITEDGVSEVVDFVGQLPEFPEADRASVSAWTALHRQARLTEDTDAARDLATTTLGRLITHIDALPADLPAIPRDAPAAPRVGALGAWLRAAEAAQGTDTSGRLIGIGLQLGLLGVNVPVDTRAVAVIASDLERPSMQTALQRANSVLVGQVVDAVISQPTGTTRSRLMLLTRYDGAADAIRRYAEEKNTFEAQALWQHTRVTLDPATRAESAAALARIADRQEQEAEIRALWGEGGPASQAEMAELISAYQDAGRPVPDGDIDRGFKMLMNAPLPTRTPPSSSLGYVLGHLVVDRAARPEYLAWWCCQTNPQDHHSVTLEDWAHHAVTALSADAHRVPDNRWQELLDSVARTLVGGRRDPAFWSVLAGFRAIGLERLGVAMGQVHQELLEKAHEKRVETAAQMFRFWLRVGGDELTDLILPTAFQSLSSKERGQVGDYVPDDTVPEWEAWEERNPRKGVVSRMFGRRSKDGE